MDIARSERRCTRCGTPVLQADLAGLCPACLLGMAMPDGPRLSGPEDPTRLADSADGVLSGLRLTPGQVFGRFRIERLLGRGGMGEVYAAQQIDNGRRVALKVLSERLNNPHDRARFFREGQLAASVNHPNSVYIYGTEEIDGAPVISMELLSGGTLKDRVRDTGPLPPTEAVEAVLQVLAGLDAAQAAGILHRDVKPSNCFIDGGSTVKIGDFGLSISALARDTTRSEAHEGFRGTPQFASPEQLRGAALDVRADIYAVGATLYYLLTGSAPIDAPDLPTLVSRVASQAVLSPRARDKRVPRGLARVVLQCLEKDPASRPASHAELARQLYPFRRPRLEPAELGLRFAAGLIDAAVMIPMLAAGALMAYVGWGQRGWGVHPYVLFDDAYIWVCIVYFTILEGLWGTSLGKRVIGLRRVRSTGKGRPGLRALLSAGIYMAPNLAVRLTSSVGLFQQTWWWQPLLALLAYFIVLGALFVGARRQSGFAAVHDVLSGTRVVEIARIVDARVPKPAVLPADVLTLPVFHRGPFAVHGSIRSTTEGELLDAFDPILRRKVWIHEVPPVTRPLPSAQRDASRAGHLRWLAGTRSEGESWDAFEALDGRPLVDVLSTVVTWSQVKQWLADLTQEMSQIDQAEISSLTAGRVWITAEHRAKLVGFEIAGAPPLPSAPPIIQAQRLLSAIADSALRGPDKLEWRGRLRLPLHARSLLDRLAGCEFRTLSEIAAECGNAATRPDEVNGRRRIAHVSLTAVPIASVIVAVALIEPVPSSRPDRDRTDLNYFFHIIRRAYEAPGLPLTGPEEPVSLDASKLAALEVYVRGRYGATPRPFTTTSAPDYWKATVDGLLARHPNVAADELARATTSLKTFLDDRAAWNDQMDAAADAAPFEWIRLAGSLLVALAVCAIAALLSAVIAPGGLVLAGMGIGIVRRDGSPISRARSLARTAVAWSPAIVLLVADMVLPAILGLDWSWWLYERLTPTRATALAMFVMATGAGIAVVTPHRGIQDRLCGTWLVAR